MSGYSFYDTDEAVFTSRTFTRNNQVGITAAKNRFSNIYSSTIFPPVQAFMFKFVRNITGSIDETLRNGISHLVLDNKFHNSIGKLKVPILSIDHEYLGNLIGKE